MAVEPEQWDMRGRRVLVTGATGGMREEAKGESSFRVLLPDAR